MKGSSAREQQVSLQKRLLVGCHDYRVLLVHIRQLRVISRLEIGIFQNITLFSALLYFAERNSSVVYPVLNSTVSTTIQELQLHPLYTTQNHGCLFKSNRPPHPSHPVVYLTNKRKG